MFVSMTGFGRSVCETAFGKFVAEIQSVNRKYLEISVYLPKEFNRFEIEIRKWVQEFISRGQVTVRLFVSPNDEMLTQLLPDIALLKGMKKAWTSLAKECGTDPKEIDLPFLLERLPNFSFADAGHNEEEQLKALQGCIEEALQAIVEMKKKEGRALSIDIENRIQELERIIQKIEKQSPDAVSQQRQKLQERMKEIFQPGAELDDRLMREIALFAERVDIAEEITRFRSHIAQFGEILKSKNIQVGRKLDFLVQEIGREINTISSKSADVIISRLCVDGKSELEKVREQIQNIE